MLSPYSQFSPQGVVGQFPGQLFGAPFAQQPTGFNPFQQGQPYQQGQWSPQYSMYAQGAQPGLIPGQHLGLQVGSLIGHLAQQIYTQCAIAQQSGLALLHVAQQLIQQSQHAQGFQGQGLQGLHGNSGIGADHLFSGAPQFAGGQPFMTQPFASPFGPFGPGMQSPYGLSPQLGPSWNTGRPTTIQ